MYEVTSIYAAPINATDLTFASSSYVEGINVEFSTSIPDIDLTLLSTMNVVKQTGVLDNDIWVKVLVDGNTVLEEKLKSLNEDSSNIDEGSTGTKPVSFNIASTGVHNITYEFKRTGNGAVEVNDIDMSLIKFTTTTGNKIRDQITVVDYTHSDPAFTNSFNWSVSTPVESGTFVIGKFSLESITKSTLQYYYKELDSNSNSTFWASYQSDSNDVGSVSGFFVDHNRQTDVNYGIFSNSSSVTTNVTGQILDFDLADTNAIGVNSFSVSNKSTSASSSIPLSEGTYLLASENVTVYNGTGYFLAMTASFSSVSGAQTPTFFINCTEVPECYSKKERYLASNSDIGNAYIYYIADDLTAGKSYNFNLWVTVETGENLVQIDEALGGFEITGFNVNSINTAPLVAIIVPETDETINGIFSVNASVIDNDDDTFLSSVSLSNDIGPVKSYTDLPQSNLSVTFDSRLYADGPYNVTWRSCENESVEQFCAEDMITISIDNNEPSIDFNDETTDEGHHNQNWVLGNITVNDMNLNASSISLFNSTDLVSSNTSSNRTHFINFTGIIDGQYYLNATAWDLAGNINTTVTRTIILDTTTPLIDFNDETTDTGNFSQSWITGNITVNDTYLNVSSIKLFNSTSQVNSSTSASATHEMNFTDLSDGYYYLNATVCDIGGNINQTQTRTILLDTQRPIVDFSADTTDDGIINQNWIFTNMTVTDTFGYTNVSFSLYNSSSLVSSHNGTDSHNFTSLTDGVYYLNFTVEDMAGNTNVSETLRYLVDTADPLIYFNDESTDTGNYSLNWILGNITVSDANLNASGIYLYNSTSLVDSSIDTNTTHFMNVTNLADGHYYLNASVWDSGDNINTTETRTVLLDTQEADIIFNSDTTSASNLSQTFIFANVSSNDAFGYDNLTIYLYSSSGLINSSSIENTGSHNYNFTGLADGVYYLNSTIVDLAGNINTTVTRTIVLDTTTPLIDFNDETTDTGNFSQSWITGNITVNDTFLNASSIRLFNSSGPVNSSISSSTIHEMNFTGLTDGYYDLNATVWDLAGNTNETQTRTILLDTQEADIIFNSDTTSASNLSQTFIFANVSSNDAFGYDNLTICLYSSSGLINSSSIENTGSHNYNFTGLADGVYYLNSTIVDLAGNINTTVTRTIVLDTTTPLIDFNDETTDTGNFSQSWITGNITVSDTFLNASSIRLFNSSGPVNSSIASSTIHEMNFTVLTDGYYDLNATVWDFAGNTNETQTRTILLDTQEADIIFNSDTTSASNLSQTFIFANVSSNDAFGYDNLTICLYSSSGLINSSSIENTGSHNYNFTGLADGVYYLNSTIVDLAGNINTTVTRTIVLDTTTPLIDFNDETTDTGNFSQSWITGNITVSDTFLNASSIRLFNSSGPVNSSIASSTIHEMNFTVLTDGYYDLNATVWDFAGNTNETQTRTILLDTQEADIIFNSDTTSASNLSQTFIFANVSSNDAFGYDNLTICLYSSSGLINSSSIENTGSHNYNFTGLADGVYYLNSTIVDLAGNINTTVTRTIVLDTTTPLIDFNDETTDTGNFSQSWITGNITVSDTSLNASSIRLFNSSGPVNSSRTSSTIHEMNFTGLTDGYYDLNATVWDLAGNVNITQTRTILLDTQESDIIFNSDTTSASNLSQTFIFANVSSNDAFGYDNLTICLYSSSGLINSSSIENTGSHNYNFTGLADGVYYLNSTIVDLAGNINTTVTRTIVLDTTTPLIDFNDETTDTGNFSQSWITGNITVSDTFLNASSIRLFNSSGPVNSSTVSSSIHKMNFTGLEDGYYQLNATVWDLAGNTNETQTRTILLDTQEADIIFNSDTTSASNLSQTFIFANVSSNDAFGYDNLTICLYSSSGLINSSSIENTGSHNYNFTGLVDGVYYLNSTIVDLAGNINTTVTRTIVLDTTTPLIDFNDETTDTGNFSQSWITGNITVSDTSLNASSIRLFNSSGPVNSSRTSSTIHEMNFTVLTDGYYDLNATVWDLAGNVNITQTRTILLDTQESDIIFNSDTTSASNLSQTFIFANVSSNDAFGYDNLTICLYSSSGLINSSSAENTGSHNYNFTGLADGIYYLNSTIVDLAGNINTTVTRTIVLDTTTPLIDFNDETTNTGNFSQSWITGNITVSDTFLNASSIRLFNSSGPVNSSRTSTNTYAVNFTGLADGYYQLNASVWDFAGNINETQTRNILLDTGVPHITFDSTMPAEGNYSRNYLLAAVNISDTFGIANITFDLYNRSVFGNNTNLYNSTTMYNPTSGRCQVNFTSLPFGLYTLNVTITDLAGNINNTTSLIYGIDAVDMEINNMVTQLQDTSINIIWDTNEVTNSTVYYGRDTNVTFNISKADFELNHSIRITGLKDDTLYYYKVVCCDLFGFNKTTQVMNFTTEKTYDDDGSAYYNPVEPVNEDEDPDEGQETGSVTPRTVTVNAGNGEAGESLSVNPNEGDLDGGSMVMGINIELGMDVGELDVTCSQSPASSQEYPMDIALVVGSGANIYGYVNIDTSNPGCVDGATIQFCIPAAWYDENDLNPTSTTVTHFADGSPQLDVLEVVKSSNDAEYYYFTVRTPGFSEFSVAALPYEEAEEEIEEDTGNDVEVTEETGIKPEKESSSGYMWLIPVVALILGLMVFVIRKKPE